MKKTISLFLIASIIALPAEASVAKNYFGRKINTSFVKKTTSTRRIMQAGYGSTLTFSKDYTKGMSIDADYAVGSKTGTFSATRGASNPATYIDQDGKIQVTTSSNIPRFTSGYYSTSGFVSQPGLMIEGASTNLIKGSYIDSSFTVPTTTWLSGGLGYWASVIQNGAAGTRSIIDSTIGLGGKAARITITTAGTGTDAIQFFAGNDNTFSITSGTVYTVSAWVRASFTGTIRANVLKHTTPFTNYGLNNSPVSVVANTWVRVQSTFTANTTASDARLDYFCGDNGTFTIDFDQLQVEAAPFASTFIPTTTATLTRNAETLTYPISGNRTAATESVFFKYTPFYNPATITNYQALIDTDTKRRYMTQFYSGAGTTKIKTKPNSTDSTLVQLDLTSDVVQFTSTVIAAAYQHSSPYIAFYKDGAQQATYTTGDWTDPVWGTNMHIGHSQAGIGNEQLFGIISSIAIFSDAKSAGDVSAITNLLNGSI